jgi:aminopeptidase N
MKFAQVQVDGEGVSYTNYDGALLEIVFQGESSERRVSISYQLVEPADGLLISAPDSAAPDRALFCVVDNETERAQYWVPCIDHPQVRTTVSYSLSGPERFQYFANGAEDGVSTADGVHTAGFNLKQPCPSYLLCIAVGELISIVIATLHRSPSAAH